MESSSFGALHYALVGSLPLAKSCSAKCAMEDLNNAAMLFVLLIAALAYLVFRLFHAALRRR
jgi:hypothetical protein